MDDFIVLRLDRTSNAPYFAGWISQPSWMYASHWLQLSLVCRVQRCVQWLMETTACRAHRLLICLLVSAHYRSSYGIDIYTLPRKIAYLLNWQFWGWGSLNGCRMISNFSQTFRDRFLRRTTEYMLTAYVVLWGKKVRGKNSRKISN